MWAVLSRKLGLSAETLRKLECGPWSEEEVSSQPGP